MINWLDINETLSFIYYSFDWILSVKPKIGIYEYGGVKPSGIDKKLLSQINSNISEQSNKPGQI